MKKIKTWILECEKGISKRDLTKILAKKRVSNYYNLEKLATASNIEFYCVEEYER